MPEPLPDFAGWLVANPYRPENAKDGSKSADEIFSLIGKATTAWETNELLLAFLFKAVLSSESRSSLRAFGAVIGSGTRVDMVSYAAESYFHGSPNEHKSFQNTLKFTRRCAALRNIIAHGMVVHIDSDGLHTVDYRAKHFPDGAKFFLTPAMYNASKTNLGLTPKIMWSHAEVQQVIEQFHVLSVHLIHHLDTDSERPDETHCLRFTLPIAE